MKVVINACYGGFGLSPAATRALEAKQCGHYDHSTADERACPALVDVVEALGSKASSRTCAELVVIDIPDGAQFEIAEYDGFEHIAEKHRKWYAEER